MTPDKTQRATSYRFLASWILIASLCGGFGVFIVQAFRVALAQVIQLMEGLPVHPVVFAAFAAILVGTIVYRISPNAAGEGIPSYLYYLTRRKAVFPLRSTIMKLPAAFLTLAGGGSGGLIGPLGRVNAGISAYIARRIVGADDQNEYVRTAAICGMSATVASIFHAPLAAGFFAVEIIQRANMRYRDLFPSLLSATAAVWIARALGWSAIVPAPLLFGSLDHRHVLPGIGFALLVALLSWLYSKGYAVAVDLFRRERGRVVIKVVLGMVSAVTITAFTSPALGGTAVELTTDLLGAHYIPEDPSLFGIQSVVWVSLLFLLIRAAVSFLTIGSGMSAGLAAPAMQLGALLAVAAGAAVSGLIDVNLVPVFTVIGICGMLAGSMNVPIAASVLAVELFGPSFGMAGVIAAVISFQINRSSTVYDHALAGSGHIDSESD